MKNSDIMIIAAKPQNVPAILKGIGADVSREHLIMCIAAGVRLSTLETALPQARVVRLLNLWLPALFLPCASLLCRGPLLRRAPRPAW